LILLARSGELSRHIDNHMPTLDKAGPMNIRSCMESLALIALGTPLLAFAALGGPVDSIQSDQVRMKAARRDAVPTGKYTVHELRTPAGTVIREYADLKGQVFAVAWDGPSKPDMNQLLGEYFSQYNEGMPAGHASRRHLSIRNPGLVIQSSGHMRAFSGKAYLPQNLPEGVSVEELQ
jgi:Protein of unknown function (DUF2844)